MERRMRTGFASLDGQVQCQADTPPNTDLRNRIFIKKTGPGPQRGQADGKLKHMIGNS